MSDPITGVSEAELKTWAAAARINGNRYPLGVPEQIKRLIALVRRQEKIIDRLLESGERTKPESGA